MYQDIQGLEVTTHSLEAIAAIDRFIEQMLSYGNQAEAAILAAIAADPACAIAQAYAAAYYLCQENALDRSRAIPFINAAKQTSTAATPREQAYISAIAAWSQRDIHHAIDLHQAIAQQTPTDLLSIQQGQYHAFYLGHMPLLLNFAETALATHSSAHVLHHYLLGMTAFGLEQCGQLAAAESMAHQAIALNSHDPWAHHALAHVWETQNRVEEGIAWMEQFAYTWEHCNSMLHTHNWWHVALFYLAHGNVPAVLQLYDERVWGRARRRSPKDQVGAIATLLRLELRGVSVGDRWNDLADYLHPRLFEHALPFQDVHYIYALARAERSYWLTTMLHSMQAHVSSLAPHQQAVWTEVALPAAEALIAHAQQRYDTASDRLRPVLAHLGRLGGSHAQRALFNQVYQHAHTHAARHRKVIAA
jgi:hypothetical protein